jgi:hypothetical protein
MLSEKSFLAVSLTNFAPCQFLKRIITANETWVHHYKLEIKAQSMAWKHPTGLRNSKVNCQLVRLCLHFFGTWKVQVRFIQSYSPDLTFINFHMFSPMKEALRGRFSPNEELIGTVQNWLKMELKSL